MVRITKQESKEIKKNCDVPVYRTQKGKSNRGVFYIQETVIFTNDIEYDILQLEDLINAYDCVKGNYECESVKNRLKRNLDYKKYLLEQK